VRRHRFRSRDKYGDPASATPDLQQGGLPVPRRDDIFAAVCKEQPIADFRFGERQAGIDAA
jgi:hypothetical protein